jgi:hypothetical protein
MSHADGAVKFPDGIIMYYEYNGTVDFVIPRLYTTKEEMEANWRSANHDYVFNNCTCGQMAEPVEILSMYGGGFWWNGKACRTCMTITEGFEPLWWIQGDTPTQLIECTWDGEPDWSPWKKDPGYDAWRDNK